jgi:hypothetical protein
MSSSRSPTSPPPGSSSRDPSVRSVRSPSILQHQPLQPSGLREAHTLSRSPEDTRQGGEEYAPSSPETSPKTHPTHLDTDPAADDNAIDGRTHGFAEAGRQFATETTALLKKPFEFVTGPAHRGRCDHGTFSPRLDSEAASIRSGLDFGGSPPGRDGGGEGSKGPWTSLLEGVGVKNGPGRKKMSTTSYLAERHGITNTTSMYVLILSILSNMEMFWISGYVLISNACQVFHILYTLPCVDTAI